VPQHVRAGAAQIRATSRTKERRFERSLSQPAAVVPRQDQATPQVPMRMQPVREPPRHRHVAELSTFGRRDVPAPIAAFDPHLRFLHIHVRPQQRPHLSRPQARLPAEQDQHESSVPLIKSTGTSDRT
jgi:hypothetical protein